MNRLGELKGFYDLMDRLKARSGGTRTLAECHGRMEWPERGVYFFFDPGEPRTDSGKGMRIVRVGTHALTATSRTTLWKRLSQHRGTTKTGGGNHRGSIFRLLVGTALQAKAHTQEPVSWGVAGDPGAAARKLGGNRADILKAEAALEQRVSEHIRALPFLSLRIDDPPGKDSQRGFIERNAIALLSNYERSALDAPSDQWLGSHCNRERVRRSGLWNNNHVDETTTSEFFDVLARLVA